MTDKIEELIESLRERVVLRRRAGQFAFADDLEQAADALAALRTQRNEVVEECARIAEEHWHDDAGSWSAAAKAIAVDIRSLKSQDEPR